jgi:hypothetical protein
LALLVALVSGVVMAAAAAGRRTSSAFPRFTAVYGYDTVAYSFTPLPGLARLPEVASSTEANFAGGGTPRCACAPINPNDFDVSGAYRPMGTGSTSSCRGACPIRRRTARCWRRSA